MVIICTFVYYFYFLFQVKAHKLKQSWKKVYTKDPDSAFTTARTFHLNDEQETEIGNDEVVDGEFF